MHIFNSHSNPIVGELLKLLHPPYARLYEPDEQEFLAESLIAKLYGLQRFRTPPRRRWGRWIYGQPWERVSIQVVWDPYYLDFSPPPLPAEWHHLITVGIARDEVLEIFNGPNYRTGLYPEEIRRRMRDLERYGVDDIAPEPYRIPHRSDEALSEAYFPDGPPPGRNDNNNDNRGGGDGNNGPGGPRGPDGDGNNGTGGIREIVSHPVLFAIDARTYSDILEQT